MPDSILLIHFFFKQCKTKSILYILEDFEYRLRAFVSILKLRAGFYIILELLIVALITTNKAKVSNSMVDRD